MIATLVIIIWTVVCLARGLAVKPGDRRYGYGWSNDNVRGVAWFVIWLGGLVGAGWLVPLVL